MIAKITSSKGKYYLEITGNGDKKIQIDGLESVVAHSKSIIEIAKSYFTEIK
jgi:hypothetical protein